MFQRVAQYETVTGTDGVLYRPRAYAEPRPDGTWAGYLVFFPSFVDAPVVSTDAQTVQSSIGAVAAWAVALTDAALHDGLARALTLEPSSSLASTLLELHADSAALEDAADAAGAASRVAEDAAVLHETDAAAARAESRALQEEESLYRREAAAATQLEAAARAELHDRSAQGDREAASDAAKKRKATSRRRGSPKAAKKKEK